MLHQDTLLRPKGWSIKQAAYAFEAYLSRETLSENTIFHYMHDIRMYCRYLEDLYGEEGSKIPASAITRDSITAFLEQHRTQRKNKESSMRRRIACLRKFTLFLNETGLTPERIEVHVTLSAEREKPGPPQGLNAKQTAALLDALRTITPDPERDYPLFLLFLRCGCHLGEVLRLTVDDLDLTTATLRVTNNYGQQRVIPLPLDVHRALATYLSKREKSPFNALFLNRWSEPITKGAVQNVLRTLRSVPTLRSVGLNVTKLRDTGIIEKVNLGWAPETLAAYLGAENPSNLDRYYAHAKWNRPGPKPPFAA